MFKAIPTEEHLSRVYYELAQIGANSVGAKKKWPYRPTSIEELIALAADMSRHDPRLFGILVSFFHSHWHSIDPLKLRGQYSEMDTPQVIAVVAEFLLSLDDVLPEKRFFLEYLQRGLKAVPLQFFYQHLYKPGGNMSGRAIDSPLSEYKRWGFLAREAPVLDEESRRTVGTRDASSRKNILLRLFDQRDSIGISDYLKALDFKISRQQALLDLKSIDGIECVGRGRGAKWRRVA